MKTMTRILALLGMIFAPALALAQTPPSYTISSTAIEGSHIFCSQGGCRLWSLTVTTNASAGYLLVFDSSTDPADGALSPPSAGGPGTTPAYCYAWPAGYSANISWPSAVQFRRGLTAVFSTGADCVHKTESATAFFTAQVQ